ncbi:MAG: mycothiol system anti-sigma-R factor [Actinomycetota bacterium]
MALSDIECQRFLEQIELYLDGELMGYQRTELEEHLGHCGPCMDRSDFQRRLRELIKAKCGCDEVPDHLLEHIRGLLAESHQHSQP